MYIPGTIVTLSLSLNVCLAFYLQLNKVEVFPGESVLLPCNSSGFPSDELHWEAMGKHVAVLHEGNITEGPGYENRVFLEDPTASEDFSLVLRDVMFNDGGIYECLWKGQTPVCSVFVDVLKPLVFPVFAAVGEDVTLHCFGNIPTNNLWDDLDIQWLKDEREVLRLTSGKIDINVENSHMSLPFREEISRGIFSLTITSVRGQDQGVYQCLYKSTDYKDQQMGLPETHTLTVLDISSETSSTVESILSTSNSSHISSSVSSWTDAESTEWSSPVSSHSYVEDTETATSSSSSQTSANTLEVSATVESILSISNSSYNETSSSVSSWTDAVSTEWSSPVSSHSYVEDTETDVTTSSSAQTSANTPGDISSETSSSVESILSTSNSSHIASSVSSWTDAVSTEWSSPVSSHSYVEDTETVTSSSSAQTSAYTAEEMTDVAPVLETGTSSGLYSSLELLSDEKIPWILVGLISGVLLITAGVLISLLLFSRN